MPRRSAVRDAARPRRDRPRRAAGAAARRSAAPAIIGERGREAGGPVAAARSCSCSASCFSTRAGCRRSIPPRSAAGLRRLPRRRGAVRPPRSAGLGRQHDAHRVRRADRHPGERARLRPLQSVLRLGAGADRLAGLAVAPGRLSHDLPAPVRPPLLPPRPGDAGARLRARFSAARPRRLARPPYLLRPRSGAAGAARARRRGTAHLHLRDHDGQSRPVARQGAADRSRGRRPVRSAAVPRGRASCCAISTGCAAPTRCCRS